MLRDASLQTGSAGRLRVGGALSVRLLLLIACAGSTSALARDVAPVGAAYAARSSAPVDAEGRLSLVEGLDAWILNGPLGSSRTGVHVVSVSTGEEIYSRGADRLLNPASNIKLVTAAAALELLGPEYRFKTEIWADSPPDASGVVRGNVYVKGFGDPSFVTERMLRLVLDLRHQGVRTVTGDIVIDESFFGERRGGPGWEQEDSDRAYIAPVGAVSLNRNAVAIHVRPSPRPGQSAIVSVDPESDFFIVENRVVTGSRRSRLGHRPSSLPEGDRQRVLVRGVHPVHIGPRVHWRRIDNPPMYFGATFKAFMLQQGVRFNRGNVRLGVVPDDASLLHTLYSAPLAEVLGQLNKVSNNHVAEMLVNVLGAEVRGVPGTWEKGADAVAEFLERFGIRQGGYVFRNGSGLNDVNRMSPRQLTTLLSGMWDRFQTSPEFVASLPVAGRDGTTHWRMTEVGGWVRAKTGTLHNVSALSGYVGTPQGEVLAFSVVVNDPPGPLRSVISGIDGVPIMLASHGLPPDVRLPRTPSPTPMESVPDMDERAALYLALFDAADARNTRYLQRAFESEHDAVLRLLAADAIYRSDPELGATDLLDSFSPCTETVGRLRRHSPGLVEPIPVLSSVADLAARGCPVAMRLLISAAHASVEDRLLGQWFAETLSEVGRAAPDDLLTALLELEGSSESPALALLAEGLRLDAERPISSEPHPFKESLGVAVSVDEPPQGVSEASVLGERLERLMESSSMFDDDAEDGAWDEQDEPEPAAMPADLTPTASGASLWRPHAC